MSGDVNVPGNNELVLDSLSVRLGEFQLADVGLTVTPGEVVGLVGHNGAGKTTTFRIIADLVRPAAGTVRLGDLDHRRDEREFKQHVGFVGDNKSPYAGMRVQDALAFATSLYPHWDDELCRRMCRELHLPSRTKVTHLSTGMHTKLGIVLALSAHPRMLILDEPTSGLDSESREWIWDALERSVATDGVGILTASHSRTEVAAHCTSVVALTDGRVSTRRRLDRGDVDALAGIMVGG